MGVAVGTLVGGVAGGLAGKAGAEAFDPTEEDAYWRANHSSQPWADREFGYDVDYAPAYRYGADQYARRRSSWDEAEDDLRVEWEKVKGESRLKWEQAKQAVRAGWHRVETALPGDFDGDGR